MIPRIFHYIWVGGAPFPPSYEENIATWKKFNPGYDLVRWDERNIDFSSPVMRRVYRLGYWARVADIARLQILHEHGGIYLDLDMRVIKTFDGLLDYRCFIGFSEDGSYINNAVIGSEARHWLMRCALKRINDKTGVEKMDPSYGPILITGILMNKNHGRQKDEDIFIAPKTYFSPLDWAAASEQRENIERYLTPDTICIHLHEHTWKSESRNRSLTSILQTLIRRYPSLVKSKYAGTICSLLVFMAGAASGNFRFLTRKMPWQAAVDREIKVTADPSADRRD